MDEAVLGFEARPQPVGRSCASPRSAAANTNLVGVVDVGVPESTYTTIGVPDTGIDVVGAQDDQILLFYNRSPSTFGADRYLLTNPADDEAIVCRRRHDRPGAHTAVLLPRRALTAGRSEGIAANRGFGAIENDDGGARRGVHQSRTRAVTRRDASFTERGYTIKTAAIVPVPARHRRSA